MLSFQAIADWLGRRGLKGGPTPDADRIQSHNCEAVPLVHNEPHPTPFKDLERQLASAKPSNREVRRTFQFGRDLELKESRCERGWRGQRLATSSIRLKCCGGPGGRSWKALGFRHHTLSWYPGLNGGRPVHWRHQMHGLHLEGQHVGYRPAPFPVVIL